MGYPNQWRSAGYQDQPKRGDAGQRRSQSMAGAVDELMRSERHERKTTMTKHSLVRTLAVLLWAGTLLVPAASAAGLPVVQDAYISSGAPTTNFGTAATLS